MTFETKRVIVLLVLFAALLWFFGPFLDVIVAAGITAYLFSPLNKRVGKILNNKTASALFVLTLVLLLLILPALYLYGTVVLQAFQLSSYIATSGFSEVPVVADFLNQYGSAIELNPPQTFNEMLGILVAKLPGFALKMYLFTFLLFFFLLEGERLAKYLNDLAVDTFEHRFVERSARVLHSTIYGNFLTAIVIGSLTSVALFVLGVPYSLLLGFVVTIFTFIPVFGYWIVLFGIAGYMYSVGSVTAAAALVLFTLVMAFFEVIMRVKLSATALHPVLFAFGFFLGVIHFGLAGTFLGPVIVAILKSALDAVKETGYVQTLLK